VRADDVLSVRDNPLKLRLVVRFSRHQRVRQPAPAAQPRAAYAQGIPPSSQGRDRGRPE
jgi:hypothetical protein